MQLDEILEEMDDCIRETREKFKGYEDNEALRLYVSVMNLAKTIVIKHMTAKDKNVPTNDGWIPVDERLPKNGEEVIVWYEYFRYGEYNRMYETYGIGWQYDGHWSGDVSGTKARCIAWRPLPEPYRSEQRVYE